MSGNQYDERHLPVAITCVSASGITLGLVLADGNLFGAVVVLTVHGLSWGWCLAALREKYQRRNPWRRTR